MRDANFISFFFFFCSYSTTRANGKYCWMSQFILTLLRFSQQWYLKKTSNSDFTMMLMIPVAGITAAEGQEVGVLQMENSASPPPYFFLSAGPSAVWGWPIIFVFLRAKSNKTFLAANYFLDKIKGGGGVHSLHPVCSTRPCCREKNKSTFLFFPVHAEWLDAALYASLFLLAQVQRKHES